jgi:uncharacterized protein (TIGR04255 family)
MTRHYDNPPIVELVCGVHFQYLDRLKAPHYGLLWEKFREKGFIETQEVPPLSPSSGSLQLSDVPPLPRVMFQTESGEKLIQVQRDRFLVNWRRMSEEQDYPRFENVFEAFLEHAEKFKDFLSSNGLGSIEPLEYELTYSNQLFEGEDWENISNIGELFPDFSWRESSPKPNEIKWHTTWPLPEGRGNLRTTIQSGKNSENKKSILRFDISAKGMHESAELLESMRSWFELAHEESIEVFEHMTSESVRDQWGESDDE